MVLSHFIKLFSHCRSDREFNYLEEFKSYTLKGKLPLPATVDGFAVDHFEEKGRLQNKRKYFR